jgi:myo-inositol-1(or 4)-monophosphatase
VIDPIDGTAAYMKGAPWFTVAVALIENGERSPAWCTHPS